MVNRAMRLMMLKIVCFFMFFSLSGRMCLFLAWCGICFKRRVSVVVEREPAKAQEVLFEIARINAPVLDGVSAVDHRIVAHIDAYMDAPSVS